MLAALSSINFQKLAIISRFLSLVVLVIEWPRRLARAQCTEPFPFRATLPCGSEQWFPGGELLVHGWGTQRPSMKWAERKSILHSRSDYIPYISHLTNTHSNSCRARSADRVLVPTNKLGISLRSSSDCYAGKSWAHTWSLLPLSHVIK